MSAARQVGSRLHVRRRARACSAATAAAVLAVLVAPLGAGQAFAQTLSHAGTSDLRPIREPAGAVVSEGSVARAAAGATPVEAVLELTPPAGSDRVVARLAATRSGLSRAQRLAALATATPPVSAQHAVVAWAARHGLAVTRRSRWLVTVSGSPTALAAAFSVPLVAVPSRFDPAGPARYVRPASAPRVPVELAGVARAVTGLDSRPTFAPRVTPLARATSSLTPAALGDFGFTGQQLRDAYDVPRDPSSGAGVTVATIQFSGFATQDFVDYAQQAGIPLFAGQLTTVSVDGADPATISNGGDLEVDLDTQAILAVAPMARQRAYFPPNSLAGEVNAFSAMADDAEAGLVQAVSTSWGHCEAQLDPGEASLVRNQVLRLVAAGVTVSASSGDGGSNDCGSRIPGTQVDFPASIPEVVSVGGTHLAAGYQTAWSGSGGGESAVFARPAYQNGLGGSGGRLVPDVALVADPQTGFAVVRAGGFGTVGGTSLAAPLFAGLLAGMLSSADRSTGVGDVHTALYAADPAGFQDVLSGANGVFAAGAGYDEVTGLGAPRFGVLAAALGLSPAVRAAYHPIDPTRIADTRNGTGTPQVRLGPGQTLTLTVAGSAPGVPAHGVTAAVVNVTAVSPSVSTYLSVFPTGASGATSVSAVNAVPGTPTPNLVTVKLDAAGRFSVYNHAGTVDLVVDLTGYYARDSGDLYTAVHPTRVLDTRSGTGVPGAVPGKVGPGGTLTLHVAGAAGLPASGIDAVALNLTAVDATAATHVAAFPAGFAGGGAVSNLNVPPAAGVANLAVVEVSTGGDVSFLNAFGSVDLVADVEGYYTTGSGLAFVPVPPVRILDTRPGRLGTNASGRFLVAASGARASAVVLNLTGVSPTSGTFLSLFPASVPVASGRTTSVLNLSAHAVRANLTTTAVDLSDPQTETVYNHLGTIAVVADVSGYFTGQPPALPPSTTTLSAPGSVSHGTSETFTATVASGAGSVASLAPGSVVDFVEPGVGVLGSAVVTAGGTVTWSKTWSSAGSHTVYAVLAAHDGVGGSTSDPVVVTVT